MTGKEFALIMAVFFFAFFSTLNWIKPAKITIEIKPTQPIVKPVGQLPSGKPTQDKDL